MYLVIRGSLRVFYYEGHVHDLLNDLGKERVIDASCPGPASASPRGERRAMNAIRVHAFGGVDALVYEEMQQPVPAAGQALVRVKAAGVGPWDAWVRGGTSAVPHALPLTPGADLAGIVEHAGADVPFHPGDEVYGVTNGEFVGAYAEYAVATATMLAPKPHSIGFVAAASVPVVACTAWQMLFEHGGVDSTKRVLVHGGAGNVGAYAVQMAKDVAQR